MCVYNLCCWLQTLRECLRQVTSATDDMKEEEQVEEVEGANLERKKEESLAKFLSLGREHFINTAPENWLTTIK